MRFGSVCSGIEAASVALNPLGFDAAWFAQFDPERKNDFPSSVLAHHYPDIPNLGDMTQIAAWVRCGLVEAPELLIGGTPCQSFSVAGLRGGLSDVRGQLTMSYIDLLNAIDEQRSGNECVAIWENVPGVLSSTDNAFGCFLAGLAGENGEFVAPGGKWSKSGCVFGRQRAIAWRTLDAQYFGVAQRRKRVFVIASAREGFNPAKLLFEFNGVRRDIAPSRNAQQTIAGTIGARTELSVGAQDASCGHMIVSYGIQANTINRQSHNGGDGLGVREEQAPTLTKADRHVVASYRMVAYGEYSEDGSASTLLKRDYKDAKGLVFSFQPQATASQGWRLDSIAATIDKSKIGGVLQDYSVRRLMPVECARLQGFPDNHLDIIYNGKPAKDSPKYEALGNSMAVPVIFWLGLRILTYFGSL